MLCHPVPKAFGIKILDTEMIRRGEQHNNCVR